MRDRPVPFGSSFLKGSPLAAEDRIAVKVFEAVAFLDVLAQQAFVLHPEFLQDATGGGVASEVVRAD